MTDLPFQTNAPLLTVNEVAALFRVTPKTIRRWIERGSLPAIQMGRGWRIARGDLKQLAADRGNDVLRHVL